jgi:hypothetical protein
MADIKTTDNTELNNDSVKISIREIYATLRNILATLIRAVYINPATGNIKIEAVSGTITTVTTVTTVATVTNLNQIASVDPVYAMIHYPMKINWALTVRNRIT